MKNLTGNNGRTFSKSIAAGLVLLLVLAGWTPAAAARKTEIDWSKAQAIKPGIPITVVIHKDRGFRGNRKLRGRFQSATDDSITLKMEYGPMRTLPRSAVRKVAVHYRPPKSKRDWSRVQTVALGTPAAVMLYKNPIRRIKGYFYSATEDSVTLTLKDGQRHTFSKWDVRKVLVHRPLKKRYPGWIAAAAGSAGWLYFVSMMGTDLSGGGAAISGIFFIAIPTAIAFLAAPKKVGIYNVPFKHRTQPPTDQPSGAQGKAPGKQKNRQ